jgi:pimeloyl-ACP methyl ester carboxylesterase
MLAVGAISPGVLSDRAEARGPGQVYLLRGLANVFSLGMDQLAGKLQHDGIAARTLNHAYWPSIAADIAADYRGKRLLGPIAIVGHSIGATAATLLAARLAEQKIPVALLVAYDPSFEVTVSRNVRRAVGFHTRSFPGLKPGDGFRGSLKNIQVSSAGGVNHITIDKSRVVHDRTIAEIKHAFGRR